MIKFKILRYKNFLSFGNQFTEIQLDRSPTTLIVGENGAGKSTFLDALTFVLYGKPFRKINKPQLVNSVNGKQCVVECEFEIGKKHFLVRRGIKPAVFEIIENGDLIDQEAAGRDYQGFLERNILKMNYTAFTQVVVLGKATYVPFMRLKTHERREIIEELLGLTIFSKMNDVLKRKMSAIRDESVGVESEIKITTNQIELRERYIEQMTQDRTNQLQKIKGEIKRVTKELKHTWDTLNKYENQRERLINSMTDDAALKKRRRELEKFKVQFNSKIASLKKDINFFNDNDTCPTCEQTITEDFKAGAIGKRDGKAVQLNEGLVKLNEEILTVEDRLSEYDEILEQINELNLEIRSCSAMASEEERHLERLEDNKNELTVPREDVDKAKTEFADLTSDLEKLQEKRAEINTTKDYMANIAGMLKDSGIKSLIVQKYLPIFNNLINQHLTQMGFFVQFNLDETFNETILSRYRDSFSYSSFSEGEKLRIDLAILLTWREIAKIKNAMNTNLLIMDEIFDSSLDQTGVDSFIDLIPTMEKVNIFVISHTPTKLADKFRSTIKFTKVGNFSELGGET